MSFGEFLKDIKKVNGQRVHKIRNSYGLPDYYKYFYSKYGKHLSKKIKYTEYSNFIKCVIGKFIEELFSSGTIAFPSGLGLLDIKATECGAKLDEKGNLVVTKLVDWDATLKLWYQDEESRKNKSVVKIDSNLIYRIRYLKQNTKVTNKKYICFRPNRVLKQRMSKLAKTGMVNYFYYEHKDYKP